MRYIFVPLLSLIGAFIQRVSGFGFGMFVMVFFPYFTEFYGQATALSGLINAPMSGTVVLANRKYVRWSAVIVPIIASTAVKLFCIPIVAQLKNATVLKYMLGGILIVLSIWFFFFNDRVKIKPTVPAGIIAGMCSGFLDSFFAMGGPPVVIYFLSCFPEDKKAYHSTLQFFFFTSGVISLILRALNGMFTVDIFILAACGIVGMLAGVLLGKIVFGKLPPKVLRKVIYGFMAVSGVVMLLTAGR